MSKFKVGDLIRPSYGTTRISGVIEGFRGNDYEIRVTSLGDLRNISIYFIDDGWELDEDSIVDKILTKYGEV